MPSEPKSYSRAMDVRPLRRLPPPGLVMLLEAIAHPAPTGLTSEQLNLLLIEFCLNCPDPVGAMDLVLEPPNELSPAEITRKALAMPHKAVSTWSEQELDAAHPLRHMKLPD